MQSSQSEKQILHRDQVSHDKSADKIIHPMPDTKTLKKTFEKDASDTEPKLFSTIYTVRPNRLTRFHALISALL